MAWATFARDHVRLDGSPRIFRSSSKGQRLFCPRCGTQIIFQESEASPTIDVNIVTLDDPTALRPDHHIWTSSRLDWFETDDDLPRFPGEPPTA